MTYTAHTAFLKKAYKKEKPVFACISGSTAYGFPSLGKDIDIRACHIAPTKEILSMHKPTAAIEIKQNNYDFVSYEIEKFIGLMLKGNGNILENLYTKAFFDTAIAKKLRAVGKGCITKSIYPHYQGFAYQIYKRAEAKNFMSPKEVMYIYRVLLTGINALKTGKIEINVNKLPSEALALRDIANCIAEGKFEEEFPKLRGQFIKDVKRLMDELDKTRELSTLPERPASRTINDAENFLLALRKKYWC